MFHFILVTGLKAQSTMYIEVPMNRFNYFNAMQQSPNWSWAASIQMVLNYYGVNISQRQIVERTFISVNGQLPDLEANISQITDNLNNWNIDNNGRRYKVVASWGYGAPDPRIVVDQLRMGKPIIVLYKAVIGYRVVVLIGAEYFINYLGGTTITSVTVMDPYPGLDLYDGRIVYPAEIFAPWNMAYWYVTVY